MKICSEKLVICVFTTLRLVSRTSRNVFAPEKRFQKPWRLLCTEPIVSTGFAFKQTLYLCSVSNLRILLVFQLRTFKVVFSGPKTFRGFRETGPWILNTCLEDASKKLWFQSSSLWFPKFLGSFYFTIQPSTNFFFIYLVNGQALCFLWGRHCDRRTVKTL